MSMSDRIQQKLESALTIAHLEIVNESHMHSVPPGSETHFKVVLVSPAFEGLRAVARHQRVYGVLAEEMKGGIHALALHLYTPGEWSQEMTVPASPLCRGGGKSAS